MHKLVFIGSLTILALYFAACGGAPTASDASIRAATPAPSEAQLVDPNDAGYEDGFEAEEPDLFSLDGLESYEGEGFDDAPMLMAVERLESAALKGNSLGDPALLTLRVILPP